MRPYKRKRTAPRPKRPKRKFEPGDRVPILLSVGEVFLKGRNRMAFVTRLAHHAEVLLRGIEGVAVLPLHLRLSVWCPPSKTELVVKRLQRLFGITSIWPAERVASDPKAIVNAAVAAAKGFSPSDTFRAVVKRRDKSFPVGSVQLAADIGHHVIEEVGLRVDLRAPTHTLTVEIAPEYTFLYSRTIPGPGGLPIGSAGRVGLLISGGIDSPVAGWAAMRRGCKIDPLYFHSFPYTGDKTKAKVEELCRVLGRYQGNIALTVVPFAEAQTAIRDHTHRGDLFVLLYRRMMMRVASKLAADREWAALVTGESLGQVASQTLANLSVVEDAASVPVLRPLITQDKHDIMETARSIGSYETSILPYDDACSLFVPKGPATNARIKDAEKAERGLDIQGLVQSMLERAERVDVMN